MGSSPTKKRKVVILGQAVAAFEAAANPRETFRFKTRRNVRKVSTRNAELCDYVRRVSLRGPSVDRRLSYKDTSEAWDLLRTSFRYQERRGSNKIKQTCYGYRTLIDLPVREEDCDDEDDKGLLPDYFDYGYKIEEKVKLTCMLCNTCDSRKHPLHPCRVCAEVYHDACLKEKGHCYDDLSLEAVEESLTETGWSCPSCEMLSRLLSEDENQEIIEVFDKVAGNGTSIDRERFLRDRKETYKSIVGITMPRYREEQEEELFRTMDRDHTGTIEWWEYVAPMCVRMLSRKTPSELLRLLTPYEVERVKKLFQKFDKEQTGVVPLSVAKKMYAEWYLSLKKMTDEERRYRRWTNGSTPDSVQLKELIPVKIREPKLSWIQYLRLNALHILTARPNTVSQTPFAPATNGALSNLLHSRIESVSDEEEGVEDSIETCTLSW